MVSFTGMPGFLSLSPGTSSVDRSSLLTGRFSSPPSTPSGSNAKIPAPPGWLLFGFGLSLVGWGARRRSVVPTGH